MPDNASPLFTVFTPTYNRAGTLPRVRDSLARQTLRDFEWVIVDDGSADGTAELVRGWMDESDFSIRYFWQPNGGKHTAVNRGVREARGELFLLLDSDDECIPEALERFLWHWDSIPADQRAEFSAVTALCMDQHGRPVGDPFPQPVTDSDSLEMRYRYRVRGEKWGFHRTEVLRRFPYPVVEGERYVGEDTVWNAIARRYKTRYVNEPLRIYHVDERGGTDQLTYAPRVARYAGGLALWHADTLTEDIGWFRYDPLSFVRAAVHYSRFSFHRGWGLPAQAKRLAHPLGRALWLAGLPAGFAAYRHDRWLADHADNTHG